jgi:hypothetical protein
LLKGGLHVGLGGQGGKLPQHLGIGNPVYQYRGLPASLPSREGMATFLSDKVSTYMIQE